MELELLENVFYPNIFSKFMENFSFVTLNFFSNLKNNNFSLYPQMQAIKIKEVREFAKRNANTRYGAHLAFISETIGCIGWVVISKGPSLFIREAYDNGKHYVREIKKIATNSMVGIFLVALR